MDEESRRSQMPAEYMFKNLPQVGEHDDYAAYTVEKMDEFGIAKGMIGSMRISRDPESGYQRAPRPVHRLLRRQPEQRHGRGA